MYFSKYLRKDIWDTFRQWKKYLLKFQLISPKKLIFYKYLFQLLFQLLRKVPNTYSNQKLGIQNFHNLIRGELPLIKTKQYGTNKTWHIIPIEHKTLVDYYRKKEFWDDKYDKVDKSHLVFEFQEEEDKEDYSLEELQQ